MAVIISSRPQLLWVCTIFYGIAFLLFSLRIKARYKAKFLGLDDLFMTISMISLTAMYIASLVAYHNGLGKNQADVTLSQLIAFEKAMFAQFQGYDWGLAFLKVGLAWQLMRIKGHSHVWRICLWALLVANLIVLFVAEILDYLEYKPFEAQFEPTAVPHFRIAPSIIYGPWSQFLNVWSPISDIIFALTPTFFIWGLNRSTAERVFLCCLLALGLTCCAVTLPRIYLYYHADVSKGETFIVASLVYWSQLEVFIGMSAASIPTLRRPAEALLKRMGINLSRSSARSTPRMWIGSWARQRGIGSDNTTVKTTPAVPADGANFVETPGNNSKSAAQLNLVLPNSSAEKAWVDLDTKRSLSEGELGNDISKII